MVQSSQARIEYVCHNPASDELIVVTSNGGYGSFAVFVGPDLSQMREIAVIGVTRLRDGGTTTVSTIDGDLYIPSPMRFPQEGRRTRNGHGVDDVQTNFGTDAFDRILRERYPSDV